MRSSSTTTPQSNALARDVQNVVSDAQDLLKSVQHEGESRITEARSKLQGQLDGARKTLGELQETMQAGARQAIDTTDAYVHTNPWRAIGISAAVGALVGFLVTRR